MRRTPRDLELVVSLGVTLAVLILLLLLLLLVDLDLVHQVQRLEVHAVSHGAEHAGAEVELVVVLETTGEESGVEEQEGHVLGGFVIGGLSDLIS
jgi:uncharacterized protein (DUF58 family)